MKKYVYILVAFIACTMFNSCGNSDEVKVEAGNGKTVSVNIFTLGIGIELSDYMSKADILPFVQDQCDILKGRCNNPRTFVPTSVGFLSIDDTIAVEYEGETLTVYKYHCDVKGVAQNSFGVEGDVHLFVGTDTLDEPRFVVKNDFSGEKPYYFISTYKDSDGIFVNIPFTYNGKTYYIKTTKKTTKEFCEELNRA